MSLVLCAGYAFIQLTGLNHGYWILLTSLFVCQPNYNATRHRLALRIIGTLVGVAIGLPILLLVPSVEGQLLLIVLTGVLFFAFRNVQYAHATMFITLLVLLCFNLLGEGLKSLCRASSIPSSAVRLPGLRSALFGRTGNSVTCREFWIRP
ncbi:Inner membrane protein yccS [Raoultella terrigena]|uniref:Inner membrane protein yccS n=1 Tax=Raoultella terrigena TaxID=577 RepID=A0A4U9DG81_RAOTE|nr:Inner membrane protein yccS [Raoultella terrigena]